VLWAPETDPSATTEIDPTGRVIPEAGASTARRASGCPTAESSHLASEHPQQHRHQSNQSRGQHHQPSRCDGRVEGKLPELMGATAVDSPNGGPPGGCCGGGRVHSGCCCCCCCSPLHHSEPYGRQEWSVGKPARGRSGQLAAGQTAGGGGVQQQRFAASYAARVTTNWDNNNNNSNNNNNNNSGDILTGSGMMGQAQVASELSDGQCGSLLASCCSPSNRQAVVSDPRSVRRSPWRPSRTTSMYLILCLFAPLIVSGQQAEEETVPGHAIGGPVVEGARRGGPFSGPRRGNAVDMASLANGPLTLRNGQLLPVGGVQPMEDLDVADNGGRGRLRPLMLDREFFPPDFNFRNKYYNNLRRKDDVGGLFVNEDGNGDGDGLPTIHLTRLPSSSGLPQMPASQNFENSQNFLDDANSKEWRMIFCLHLCMYRIILLHIRRLRLVFLFII
jgi:hypothetical protein